jgi:hypothetical protein
MPLAVARRAMGLAVRVVDRPHTCALGEVGLLVDVEAVLARRQPARRRRVRGEAEAERAAQRGRSRAQPECALLAVAAEQAAEREYQMSPRRPAHPVMSHSISTSSSLILVIVMLPSHATVSPLLGLPSGET